MEGRKSDLDDLGPVSTEKEETSIKYQDKPQHFAAAAATGASTTKETTTATTGALRSTRVLMPRASDEST
eukprot:853143-Heterocapsa_arctica.AAC.1